jgi:hypothetical protein
VRTVEAMRDNKIDVAKESVEVIVAEENNIMIDSDVEATG